MDEDESRRKFAFEQAVRMMIERDASPEDVVKAAEAFHAFLRGPLDGVLSPQTDVWVSEHQFDPELP
jgi:hypothetical protein